MQIGDMKVVDIKVVYSNGDKTEEVSVGSTRMKQDIISDALSFLSRLRPGDSAFKKTADMLDDLIKRWP